MRDGDVIMAKKVKIVLLAAVLLAAAGAGYYYYLHGKDSRLTASSTIEMTKYEASPRLNGYIRGLSIKEGDVLEEGSLICEIEREDLALSNDSDWLAVEAAQAKLVDLEKGSRNEELVMAQAQAQEKKTVLDKAALDLRRAQELYSVGGVSRQSVDDARQQHDAAQQSYTAAVANYELLQAGTREDQIAQQRAEVNRLIQAAKANQNLLEDTKLYSPADGVVISKNFENNELINVGQSVLTLSDPDDCWTKVYIATADLGRVYLGQSVKLSVDSFPDMTFNGKVIEIRDEAEYTPRQSITQRERANLVFAVKIQIDNSEKKLRAGMPVDVVFDE